MAFETVIRSGTIVDGSGDATGYVGGSLQSTMVASSQSAISVMPVRHGRDRRHRIDRLLPASSMCTSIRRSR